MNHAQIALAVYHAITTGNRSDQPLPLTLPEPEEARTVQDDVFDKWFADYLDDALPEFDIFSSGALTVPDVVVRHRESRSLIGVEVKKLDANENGEDPRGLTLDYNSCVPCGRMDVKISDVVRTIPVYYFFALLSSDNKKILRSTLLNGDFLNDDFSLHQESKSANISEYSHGAYREGSVRRRAMYNYPNPMNSKLEPFVGKHSVVLKEEDLGKGIDCDLYLDKIFKRQKPNKTSLTFKMFTKEKKNSDAVEVIDDIFDGCKKRKSRKRSSYYMSIPGS